MAIRSGNGARLIKRIFWVSGISNGEYDQIKEIGKKEDYVPILTIPYPFWCKYFISGYSQRSILILTHFSCKNGYPGFVILTLRIMIYLRLQLQGHNYHVYSIPLLFSLPDIVHRTYGYRGIHNLM